MPNAASELVDFVEEGEVLLYDGDYVGARRVFQAAIALAERRHGERAKELIVPLMGLARASGENKASACEAMDRELEVQRRALAIAEASLDRGDPLLAECLHAHGVCLRDAGAIEEARDVFERFLAAHGEDGGRGIRDEVRAWLAALQTCRS